MRCERVQEMLPAYLDASLGWWARRQVKAHLETCAECRQESRALVRTVEMLRSVGGERAPRDVRGAVMAQIALLPASAPRRAPMLRPAVLVPAAGLAAAAALALQLALPPAPDATPPAPAVAATGTAYAREYSYYRASQEGEGGSGAMLLVSEIVSGNGSPGEAVGPLR